MYWNKCYFFTLGLTLDVHCSWLVVFYFVIKVALESEERYKHIADPFVISFFKSCSVFTIFSPLHEHFWTGKKLCRYLMQQWKHWLIVLSNRKLFLKCTYLCKKGRFNNFSPISESLLVISSLGVQLTTTSVTGRTKSTFFDVSEVKDIIINEAITMVRNKTVTTRSEPFSLVEKSNFQSEIFPVFQIIKNL